MNFPTAIVAYLALFTIAGFVFLFANLLLGYFLRPKLPNAEKLEVYECGEPTIGSSFVQFDLRFYVVALLFIIFDVEVAFFFPWATVYGKATHLMDPTVVAAIAQDEQSAAAGQLPPVANDVYRELGVSHPTPPILDVAEAGNYPEEAQRNAAAVAKTSRTLALVSLGDIAVFFAVLLVGFAYVWKRGDLDWVRAVSLERSMLPDKTVAAPPTSEPVLSA